MKQRPHGLQEPVVRQHRGGGITQLGRHARRHHRRRLCRDLGGKLADAVDQGSEQQMVPLILPDDGHKTATHLSALQGYVTMRKDDAMDSYLAESAG